MQILSSETTYWEIESLSRNQMFLNFHEDNKLIRLNFIAKKYETL